MKYQSLNNIRLAFAVIGLLALATQGCNSGATSETNADTGAAAKAAAAPAVPSPPAEAITAMQKSAEQGQAASKAGSDAFAKWAKEHPGQ